MRYRIKQMIGDNTTHRYVLASEGHTPLIVIGVNPSTANELKPDRTVQKVMGFAERNNYDSFVMLNLYPQRSTNFGGVHHKKNEELHQNNLDTIRFFFDPYDEIDVLVAWGNLIEERTYLLDCFRDIARILGESGRKVFWKQIGALTNAGHPRHPLYARYDLGLMQFDIDHYLKRDIPNTWDDK